MSEIQQSYALLQEIDRLLADIELKINSIEGKQPKLEKSLDTFRQVERLALRWLVLAQRMGLPEDVDGAVGKIAQLISAIRMLDISMNLMLATNPYTAAIGVAGLIGSAMTMSDVLAGY
jgi:hypothetical protein